MCFFRMKDRLRSFSYQSTYFFKKTICKFIGNCGAVSVIVFPIAIQCRDYFFSKDMNQFGHPCPLKLTLGFDCEVMPEYDDNSYYTRSIQAVKLSALVISCLALFKTVNFCGHTTHRESKEIGLENNTNTTPLLVPISQPSNLYKVALKETISGVFIGSLFSIFIRSGVREILTAARHNWDERYTNLYLDPPFRQAEQDITPYSDTGIPIIITGITLFGVYHRVRQAKLRNKEREITLESSYMRIPV